MVLLKLPFLSSMLQKASLFSSRTVSSRGMRAAGWYTNHPVTLRAVIICHCNITPAVPSPVIRYSRTLILSSLVAADQCLALQQTVASAASGNDWRVVWCGLEAMYRMFTLHDDMSLRSRLYYGVEGLQHSGLCQFLSFKGFVSSSEIAEDSNWCV